MATLLPTFSITLSQRRWACVLDPCLALSRYGLLITQRLGREVMNVWMPRELFHILDNTDFLFQHPEIDRLPSTERQGLSALQPLIPDEKALREWDQSRTDQNMPGFWIEDTLQQSNLPEEMKPDTGKWFLKWFEHLASALPAQGQQQLTYQDLLFNAASRDAVALLAALSSATSAPALILTYQPGLGTGDHSQPTLCTFLESWGIPCQQLDEQDPIVAIERDYLRHLLVHAGLSKFLWAGLRLAILHVSVPAVGWLSTTTEDEAGEISFSELGSFESQWDVGEEAPWNASDLSPWSDAKAFWYCL